jgi:hypothetical protein
MCALDLKKALIYSILILFLFNSLGYYLLFELHKYEIKKEMQAMIQKHPSKMTILTIADVENNQEFHRIDKKEFRYKGAMYDIVREIKTGQTTVFICIHDAKESELLAGLKRETQNKIHLVRWDHLIMIFLPVPTIKPISFELTDLIFPNINFTLTSPFLGTWSPPPEFS